MMRTELLVGLPAIQSARSEGVGISYSNANVKPVAPGTVTAAHYCTFGSVQRSALSASVSAHGPDDKVRRSGKSLFQERHGFRCHCARSVYHSIAWYMRVKPESQREGGRRWR